MIRSSSMELRTHLKMHKVLHSYTCRKEPTRHGTCHATTPSMPERNLNSHQVLRVPQQKTKPSQTNALPDKQSTHCSSTWYNSTKYCAYQERKLPSSLHATAGNMPRAPKYYNCQEKSIEKAPNTALAEAMYWPHKNGRPYRQHESQNPQASHLGTTAHGSVETDGILGPRQVWDRAPKPGGKLQGHRDPHFTLPLLMRTANSKPVFQVNHGGAVLNWISITQCKRHWTTFQVHHPARKASFHPVGGRSVCSLASRRVGA